MNVGRFSAGFSLAQVVIAMGVSSIVSFGIVHLSLKTQMEQTLATDRNELERIHYLAVQQAKNVATLTRQMGLVDAAGNRLNTALDRCLVGRPDSGQDCSGFNAAEHVIYTTSIGTPASGRTYDANTYMALTCTATACDNVSLRMTTELRKFERRPAAAGPSPHSPTTLHNNEINERVSVATFPGKTFSPLEQIQFDCSTTASQVLTAVNLSVREGECTGFIGADRCAQTQPMGRFGQNVECQLTENFSCSDGLGAIGLFQGNSGCTR